MELVSVGWLCPNTECPDHGKVGYGNIIRYGKSREGRQRFQCKTCAKTFNERAGTLFHGRKTPVKDILEVLAIPVVVDGDHIFDVLATGLEVLDDVITWSLAWIKQPL